MVSPVSIVFVVTIGGYGAALASSWRRINSAVPTRLRQCWFLQDSWETRLLLKAIVVSHDAPIPANRTSSELAYTSPYESRHVIMIHHGERKMAASQVPAILADVLVDEVMQIVQTISPTSRKVAP